MADTVIRPARRRDALRLTALIHASRAYGGPYASIISGYSVSTGYLERECVHVAVDADSGRLLGFYALLTGTEPPELDLLFVADEAQGRGIGMLLVDHMREQARQAGLRQVTVISHPPAESFYLRAGARRTGIRRAAPPAVQWDRPELCFDIDADDAPSDAQDGTQEDGAPGRTP